MIDTKQSIVDSLDGQDAEIFPHLAYLLQDLWEIGASPRHLIELIKRNNFEKQIKRVLDLGCGKGAVSIHMAKEFGWLVHGIDAMPEFIADAETYALKHGVGDLCSFEVGDIRTKITSRKGYDLIILGSIGPVLGTIEESLTIVRPCLNPPGLILLDDGYLIEYETSSPHDYPTQTEAVQQIYDAGYEILDELIYPADFMHESNEMIYKAIHHRALELEKKYPRDNQLFRNYVAAQKIENSALENEIVCVTWVLTKESF